MRFTIFTHVEHIRKEDHFLGYGPYIKEMNIWLRHVDEVEIVAPIVRREVNPIHLAYQHPALVFTEILPFNLTSLKNGILSFYAILKNLITIYKAMRRSDHIHLRCPGNIGLLAAVVQIAFPGKIKTAKYAGNWDPKAKQPWSYKFQRWLLSNTFLTRNMQVLVYGEWPNQSQNIKPFFTATYSESDKTAVAPRPAEQKCRLLFVGTLSPGKQPLYVVQLAEALAKKMPVVLEIYGEGKLKESLSQYIGLKNLEDVVFLKGNCASAVVQQAYEKSHFLILPSKSEGWPKVVAEAMFWGCVPVVTRVSCTASMLGQGERGVLLDENLEQDLNTITALFNDSEAYGEMSRKAQQWSRNYTVDFFEEEIKQLLQR